MPAKNVFLGSDGTPQLSENEQRFVKALFASLTAVPEADWEKCAHLLGLKDSKCAKERWRQISSKRGWSRHAKRAPCAADFASETPSTPTVATDTTSSANPATQTGGVNTRSGASVSHSTQDDSALSISVPPRQAASASIKKDTKAKAKEEPAVKSEARIKREKYTQDVSSPKSRFFPKKGVSQKSEPSVKHERVEVVEAGTAGTRDSKRRKSGAKKEIIALEDEDEEITTTKTTSTQGNKDGNHEHRGRDGAYIPFGHPNHCMSF